MAGAKVAFLEKWYGQALPHPDWSQAAAWEETFRRVKEGVFASLMMDGPLADLFGQIAYTYGADGVLQKADLSGAMQTLDAELLADPVQGQQRLADFARAVRGLGYAEEFGYLALREHYIKQDATLAWDIDSAGLPEVLNIMGHTYGTWGSEALRRDPTRGDMVINGWGGSDALYGSELGEYLINEGGDALLMGQGGNDWLSGGDGNDILDGGTGNDLLAGENGDDTYVFRKGSGQDVAVDNGGAWAGAGGGFDTVFLGAGITTDNLIMRREGNDMVLRLTDAPDTLTVQGFFNRDGNGTVERLLFQDGTEWDATELYRQAHAPTEGDDVVAGTSVGENLEGLGGDDVVMGRVGANGDCWRIAA
jgi:Ca2+-binding RTX toxin-like protein